MRFGRYKFILPVYFCAFLTLLPFNTEARVEYIGNDTETKGDWKGLYGTFGAVIFDERGDQVLEGKIDDYELLNTLHWNDPLGPIWEDERAPQSIDAPEDRAASVIYNTVPFYVTVTVSANDYQIAFYFWDWNIQSRVTDVVAYAGEDEPPADEADVTVEGEEHVDGVYEIWEISGEESVTFRFAHISGVNSMVLGFFVTGPETVSADKLSATWGGLKSE